MKRLAWSVFLLFPLGVFAQEIYRSVDENGTVVYSDRPTDDSEEIVVAIAGAGTVPVSAQRGGDDEQTAQSAESDELMAQIPREPTADEIASDRARNCEYAQQMATTYSQSHRLFRTGPDGEREYLSDEELTEARNRADANVAAWCD